jgi:demethylmenaquinone methyltransferase/2-methoxy-6-polyprenyl-1,4-benzoquinol methylase
MSEDRTHFGYRDVAPGEKTRLVREVFASVAPKYDLMNDLMSGGMHRLWKRDFVATSGVRPGHAVLDLAGGTGDISLLMAKEVGESGRVVLSDINGAMLARGRDRTIDAGAAARIACVQVNAEAIPFPDGSFDIVTIAFGLRNVTDKQKALGEMHRVDAGDQGLAGGAAHVAQQVHDLAPALGVQAGDRLVGQDDLRVLHQHAGQGNTLLLPTR